MNRVQIEEPRDFWILVTREKGIAPSPGEAVRWAVDRLIIDQDATTLRVQA